MLSKYLNLFFIFIKQIYFYTSIGFGIEEFNLNILVSNSFSLKIYPITFSNSILIYIDKSVYFSFNGFNFFKGYFQSI